MHREEKPTRCHWMLYCTYDTLNMFGALLCPSSGAQDCMCVIAAYGVQCLVAGCQGSGEGQQGVRPGRGMLEGCCSIPLPGQQPAVLHLAPDSKQSSTAHAASLFLDESLLPFTWPPTASNQALHAIGCNNTHIVSSSWWWAWKCPKHVERIISAIKHSVTSSWFFFSTHMQRCTDKHTSSSNSLLVYLILSLEVQNEIISVLSTSKILYVRLWVDASFLAVTGPAFSLWIKGTESWRQFKIPYIC